MDCDFSFGPNGAFFAKSDSIWAWSDNNTLPEPLRLILEDPNHPQANKFPYDVAFPTEPGMFSMSWKTVKGEDYYEELFLGPRYAKLAEYMRKIAQNGEHCTRTGDILGRVKKGPHPQAVALGVHGSFVVLYSDGNVTFDVAHHYPAVDAIIRNSAENARRKGFRCAHLLSSPLNPHAAGQYYVAYGDAKSLRPVGSARLVPTLPSTGVLSTGLHAAGQIWHAYQGQQQQQQPLAVLSDDVLRYKQLVAAGIRRPARCRLWTPARLTAGFDPSTLAAGLDPTNVLNGFAAVFGN
ncbi:hypothetical protein B0H14DRAFT_2691363 [Mycena olivaceomarginata]|nr:hypothetical protein B0H14DRAFT_2691363 [Mycena olivaceomarginata]